MDVTEIEALLKETIGLDAASVGLSTIERAVHQRLAACGLKEMAPYLEKVRTSSIELQELIEAVVVSETWFFRDAEAFVVLAQLVTEVWLPSHPASQLRLLSIPCATGEEPYSMAMTLDGIGLPPDGYHIDAVDISEHALARARKGLYGRNSFRGKSLDFRDIYFEAGPHSYQLSDKMRRRVLFQQENLFGPNFFPGTHTFHFIFCRNLLIYLDQAAQDRAIRTLKRLLAPDGLLFVGPAEAALMLNHDLVSIKRPLAFAFRKATASKKQAVVPTVIPAWKRIPAPPTSAAKVRTQTRRVALLRPRAILPEKIAPDLKQASRLADEGHLHEAAKLCGDYLQACHHSVDAHYLLGIIHDAMGNGEKAATHYRKALYLNPDHYESLIHLAYSSEKAGDAAAARNLNARAHRIKERAPHA